MPFTANDLSVGDQVWHKVHRRKGRVESQPRAHSTMVRLKLEGNETPNYYMIADLEDRPLDPSVATPPGMAAAKAAPLPPPATPEPPAPPKVTRPSDAAAVIHRDAYAGELTLAKLQQLRNEVAGTLHRIDAAIVKIQVQQAVKEAVATIRYTGDAEDRSRVAADAVRTNRNAASTLKELGGE
jgi:hypothetical protein